MKYLATTFILILASTQASKYFRSDHELQQDTKPRNKYQEIAIGAIDDDRFLPKLSRGDDGIKWESPPDVNMLLLSDLESLENFLQDDPNDFRIKRTKASLSIDNPLDVLREQYFRALARRMKYKSIEQNRDYLLKTGKRSSKELQDQINFSKQSKFQPVTSQKEYLENEYGDHGRHLMIGNE